MSKKAEPRNEETVLLLKHLLAIELWRAGLPQSEIRKRLGVETNALTQMLKGVSRELVVRRPD